MKLHLVLLAGLLIPVGLVAQSSLEVADTRLVPTTPDSYNRSFSVHLKRADSLHLSGSGGVYVSLLGIRPWGDDSGGKAHELVFAQNSNVYVRSGQTAGWENWRRLISEDVNGNVGIGIINPRAFLDVGATAGNTTATVLGRQIEGNTIGTGTYIGVQNYNTNQINGKSFSIEHKFYGELNSAINFHRGAFKYDGFLTFSTNNGAERMRIDGAGNVGIGVVAPAGYKLAVNGTIGARKVKVTQETWADFVFDPGYELPALQEVKKYVVSNRRLPGMPAEEEIAKEGLDIAEMQRLQMQKIEELTLYIIRLQEEIEELKKGR